MAAVPPELQPLLDQHGDKHSKPLTVCVSEVLKSAGIQAQLAWPMLLNLIAMYSVNIITLGFIGHLGKHELAAASVALSLVGILARAILSGLGGALDTQASQAYGAGNLAVMGTLFQRTVLFNWAHCVPLTVLLLVSPRLLALAGSGDPALYDSISKYLTVLVPSMWLDCIARPLNSMLVAQRVMKPQMVASFVIVPLHFAGNWFFIHYLQMGYIGAAVSTLLVNVYTILLISAYVWWTGRAGSVWGFPSGDAIKGWAAHGRLAYPACIMQCAESWGFSIVTVAAGFLPDPETSVAAVAAAFNLYGIGFMTFVALRVAVSVQVGNALGAGDAHMARVGIVAAVCLGPIFWALVAAALVEPHSQRYLMLIFTDGTDEALLLTLRALLYIVVALEAFDGLQTILSGVIQGAGKQRYGSMVNVVAFWVVAIPLAFFLGFKTSLATRGLYLGMLAGPIIQTIAYLVIVYRIDWDHDAASTTKRVRVILDWDDEKDEPVLRQVASDATLSQLNLKK